MSLVYGPFASLLGLFLQLHLVVIVISLLGDTLDAKETYICKCEDFPIEDRPFVAIWNAPTGGCSVNYSININLRDFDILENPKQTWNGKYVTVFYNAQLGLYPYFTNAEGTNSYNGGMPQVSKYSDMFRSVSGHLVILALRFVASNYLLNTIENLFFCYFSEYLITTIKLLYLSFKSHFCAHL